MNVEFVLYLLTAFAVAGSIVALQMRDLLSAVIAVGVVGLGLAIVFLLLGAPDIAITQVVVEVIVVTVLIRAVGRSDRREARGTRPDLPMVAVGSVAVLAVLAFTIAAFLTLPAFGAARAVPALWYLRHAPELTGATNVVTAILLDFRAYDTLGEATVILAAIVGTLVILRRPAREGGDPAPEEERPPPAEELRPPTPRESAEESPTATTPRPREREVIHG